MIDQVSLVQLRRTEVILTDVLTTFDFDSDSYYNNVKISLNISPQTVLLRTTPIWIIIIYILLNIYNTHMCLNFTGQYQQGFQQYSKRGNG